MEMDHHVFFRLIGFEKCAINHDSQWVSIDYFRYFRPS